MLYRSHYRRHHSSMLESFLVILVLGIFFFLLIQVTHLFVAKMVTEYAAFTVARAENVGFNSDLVNRAGLVAAIPASGEMVNPKILEGVGQGFSQKFGGEVDYIQRFIQGKLYLRYKHFDIFKTSASGGSSTLMKANARFKDYPIDIPVAEIISSQKSIDLSGDATLINHSSFFLE